MLLYLTPRRPENQDFLRCFLTKQIINSKKIKIKYGFLQELSCSPVHVYPVAEGLVGRKVLVGSSCLWLTSSGSWFFSMCSADFSRTVAFITAFPLQLREGAPHLLHRKMELGQMCLHLAISGPLDLFPSDMRKVTALLYFLKTGFTVRITVFQT